MLDGVFEIRADALSEEQDAGQFSAQSLAVVLLRQQQSVITLMKIPYHKFNQKIIY
jgi:hypothetical protein